MIFISTKEITFIYFFFFYFKDHLCERVNEIEGLFFN